MVEILLKLLQTLGTPVDTAKSTSEVRHGVIASTTYIAAASASATIAATTVATTTPIAAAATAATTTVCAVTLDGLKTKVSISKIPIS
jgi:hypothetical protein